MTICCDFTNVIGGLLVPLIAAITAYIAYQQYLTARRKLNLDLFNKRYVIYKATKDFISNVLNDHINITQQKNLFQLNTNDAKFLFNKDIYNYFEYLIKRINQFEMDYAVLNSSTKTEETEALNKKKEEDFHFWLTKEWFHIEEKFLPYLNFRKI